MWYIYSIQSLYSFNSILVFIQFNPCIHSIQSLKSSVQSNPWNHPIQSLKSFNAIFEILLKSNPCKYSIQSLKSFNPILIFIQSSPYIHSIQSLKSFNPILIFIQSNLWNSFNIPGESAAKASFSVEIIVTLYTSILPPSLSRENGER